MGPALSPANRALDQGQSAGPFCNMLSHMTTWLCEWRANGQPMKREKLELVRGSGNVFRDLGHENPDVEQFKAILAAEIIKALDRERLTVRAAHGRTSIAAADFSRIRNADLGRFTVDRLMSIINRLGSRIEVKVPVRRATVRKPEGYFNSRGVCRL